MIMCKDVLKWIPWITDNMTGVVCVWSAENVGATGDKGEQGLNGTAGDTGPTGKN